MPAAAAALPRHAGRLRYRRRHHRRFCRHRYHRRRSRRRHDRRRSRRALPRPSSMVLRVHGAISRSVSEKAQVWQLVMSFELVMQ
jgi:hypothetical protein